jgi:predicted Zn-dependent protease
MEAATHQTAAALTRLEGTLKNHPSNYPLTFTYCEWLIKYGEAPKAVRILQQQVARKPVHTSLWLLLSAAYTQAHQPIKAHLAQSQYLKILGDYPSAATQLRLARKHPEVTPQEKRQIDAELRDIQDKVHS